MTYLYMLLIIFFIIFTTLYVMSLINVLVYKVPQVSTFNSDLKILREVFWNYELKWKKIVDLWSWTWKIIRLLEKEFKMKSTWYEIDLSNTLIAKVLNKIFKSKAEVIKWNYFNADLKEYDYIYLYLFPELIEKLEKKIWKDAKKWTIIFVNAFKFKNREPIKIYLKNWKEKIFVYKI